METDLKAVNPSLPPAVSKAVAVAPSVNAQKILCRMGGSGCPLAERQSITRDPLSDDVVK